MRSLDGREELCQNGEKGGENGENSMAAKQAGDRIPCHDNWEGQSRVVIVCHGFGSSKESPMVQALHRALPERGSVYGALIFRPMETVNGAGGTSGSLLYG